MPLATIIAKRKSAMIAPRSFSLDSMLHMAKRTSHNPQPSTKESTMQKPQIKTVKGRIAWIGTFQYGQGDEAVKIVLHPDAGEPEVFGDRVEVLVFRAAIREHLMDAQLRADGEFEFKGGHAKEGDHIVASGEFTKEAWKKGRKKGTNRKIVLSRMDDLRWQRVARISGNPWDNADQDSSTDSPT